MKKRLWLLAAILLLSLSLTGSAYAQTYLFSLDREIVHVFWNEDGTSAIDYTFFFTNDPSASPIDYVDVGLPNSNFSTSSIQADIDGAALRDISKSGYQGSGSGVAVGLGARAIRPGASGKMHVLIGQVKNVLYNDSEDDQYASAVFSPTWFGSQYVTGKTILTVIYHLPPGVDPQEPRWHASPSGFPQQPKTGFDSQGRITYTWSNSNANAYTQYMFGASFPKAYVPASAIVTPGLLERLGISLDDMIGFLFCFGFAAIFILSTAFSMIQSKRRKMRYLPPKVTIEGHGIKRGLTAVEAAILMEQSMDKILTMILFSVIKKGAASVRRKDPLELEIHDPQPDGLYPYEINFLAAFKETRKKARRAALQDTMLRLVKSITKKMKGFSRKETIAYYRSITKKAWKQVEEAGTPEVKSQKYDEVMEWTMLDRDYEDRTRRVFRGGPVIIPMWWGHYDPGYGRRATVTPPSSPGGGNLSLPHLPGSDFAASMVNSVQNFSSDVIGNLTNFTSKITNKTNPAPVSRSSGGRSGGGCACACACAGCACACAGGGR